MENNGSSIYYSLFTIHCSSEHPLVAACVIGEMPLRVAALELFVAGEQSLVSFIGRDDLCVRYLAQVAFDFPDILEREAPVVISQFPQVRQPVACDPSRIIDVGIEIAPGEMPQAAKDGLAPMQAEVARARHRAPQSPSLKDEDDVVEFVLRFETHQKRRVMMLLHDDCGGQGRFQAVRLPVAYHSAKRAKRAALLLTVIW